MLMLALASTLTELLEIVVHNILYIRHVYPKAAFLKKQKESIPIWKIQHPEVSLYIRKFMKVIKKLVEKQTVKNVILSINNSSGQVVEEFIFHLEHLVSQDETCGLVENMWNMEGTLRTICLTLSNSSTVLYPNVEGCTFRLQSHVTQPRSNCNIISNLKSESFPWTITPNSRPDSYSRLIPLKTIENNFFKIQLYVHQKKFQSNKI